MKAANKVNSWSAFKPTSGQLQLQTLLQFLQLVFFNTNKAKSKCQKTFKFT